MEVMVAWFLLVFSEEYEDVACSLCKFGWFMDASTGLCTECGEAQKIGMLLGSMKVSDNSCCRIAGVRPSMSPSLRMLRSSSCPLPKSLI